MLNALPRACIALLVLAAAHAADSYDVVLSGGRVMDPASGLDGVRDVGITQGKLAAISEELLIGRIRIDVSGLVVAPGFIDLHQHGLGPADLDLKVQDGVTSVFELEIGAYPVSDWYRRLAGTSPVHYGVTISHPGVRMKAFRPESNVPTDARIVSLSGSLPAAVERELLAIERLLREGLDDGAIGIGFGINYTPKASHAEIERMFRVAAARRVPAFVHARGGGVAPVEELLDAAQRSGCALHVVHIGSTGAWETREALAAIDARRRQGVDVTTEVYPYIAGSTRIESAIFDEGWQQRLRISYGDLLWPLTGERLTAESFALYRKAGGWVIAFTMKEENVRLAIAHPGVSIASDSIPFDKGVGHPRGAGTFARVLGHYSREGSVLPLMEALRKMTLLPAQRLGHVSAMQRKGRLAVGADADVTVFDAARVIDRATFTEVQPSAGIRHVLVNGTFVLRDGERVKGALPGQPIRLPVQQGTGDKEGSRP